MIRALVMTAVIVVVSGALEVALYAHSFFPAWLITNWIPDELPRIVAIGLGLSVLMGMVTETGRLIGGPLARQRRVSGPITVRFASS